MDRVFSTYESKIEQLKKFFLLFTLALSLIPISSHISINYAETTESDGGGDGNVSDIEVSMGEDGTLTIDGISDEDGKSTWNRIFSEYKEIIVGVSGIATLTFIALFIYNFFKLGASGDNPNARKTAILALIFTFIGCAGCGSVTLFVALSWNALR